MMSVDAHPSNQTQNGAIPSLQPNTEIEPFHSSNLEWNHSILLRSLTKHTLTSTNLSLGQNQKKTALRWALQKKGVE